MTWLQAMGGAPSNSPTLGKVINLGSAPYAGGSAPQWGNNRTYSTRTPVVKAPEKETEEEQIVKQIVEQSSGGGSNYQLPQIAWPEVNVDVPDFSWNPTEAMIEAFRLYGQNVADTKINPIVGQVNRNYDRYQTQQGLAKGNINRGATQSSLAVANIVKNTLRKNAVENAIRRNATESGWLTGAIADADREEIARRSDIERARNTQLGDIDTQLTAKGVEVSDRLEELEGLRGLEQVVAMMQRESDERNQLFAEKKAKFGSDLSLAELVNAAAAAKYGAQYNTALAGLARDEFEWGKGMDEKQLALSAARSAVADPMTWMVNTTEGFQVPLTVQQLIQAGYVGPQSSAGGGGNLWDYIFGE